MCERICTLPLERARAPKNEGIGASNSSTETAAASTYCRSPRAKAPCRTLVRSGIIWRNEANFLELLQGRPAAVYSLIETSAGFGIVRLKQTTRAGLGAAECIDNCY